jgi:hypothetical protein
VIAKANAIPMNPFSATGTQMINEIALYLLTVLTRNGGRPSRTAQARGREGGLAPAFE